MTVSTTALRIKVLGLRLGVGLGLALGAGCGAWVAGEAPFVARPGSVVRGDLRGPFDGRVLDGNSGRPLAGAAVLGSWAFETGPALGGPTASTARLVETDADGRYQIPAFDDSARGVLVRFTLVIYKRGYLAWRSDRRWSDFGRRYDFAQSGNTVKLEQLPSDATHARHLRYIGAGGPLLPLLATELQEASEESQAGGASGARAAEAGTGAPSKGAAAELVLDAGALLSADELKAVTGYVGNFTVEKLGDQPSTADYDSVHYRAVDHPERYDAALRVFRATAEVVDHQFEKLVEEYPGVEQKNEVGDRSLRAREGDILAVAALDKKRGALVVFTCGVGQCRDHDTVVALLRRMWGRLDKALAGAPPPPATDGATRPGAPGSTGSTGEHPPAAPGPFQLKPPSLSR